MVESAIQFVFPPSYAGLNFKPSLGIGYIRAFLKKKGHTSSLFQSKGNSSINQMVEELLEDNSPFLGFTVYGSNYALSKILIKKIKAEDPKRIILVGGPHGTFDYDFVFETCP